MTRRRPSLAAAACVASLLVLSPAATRTRRRRTAGRAGGPEADACGPEALGHGRRRRRREAASRARPRARSAASSTRRHATAKCVALDPASGRAQLVAGHEGRPGRRSGRRRERWSPSARSDGQVIALDAAVGQAAVESRGQQRSALARRSSRAIASSCARSTAACTRSMRSTASRSGPVRSRCRGCRCAARRRPCSPKDNVIAGFDSGKVIAFALATGDIAWQAQVSDAGRPLGTRPPRRRRQRGAGRRQRRLRRRVTRAASSCSRSTPARSGGAATFPATARPRSTTTQLYVATSDGSVVALRRRDGAVVWQQDGLKRRGLSAPAVVGNAVHRRRLRRLPALARPRLGQVRRA